MWYWVSGATAAVETYYQQELIAELLNCASHPDSMGTQYSAAVFCSLKEPTFCCDDASIRGATGTPGG